MMLHSAILQQAPPSAAPLNQSVTALVRFSIRAISKYAHCKLSAHSQLSLQLRLLRKLPKLPRSLINLSMCRKVSTIAYLVNPPSSKEPMSYQRRKSPTTSLLSSGTALAFRSACGEMNSSVASN